MIKRMFRTTRLGVLALAAAAPGVAGAAIIVNPPQPAAGVYTYELHGEVPVEAGPGTYSAAGPGTQRVTLSPTPAPSIRVEVEGDTTGGYSARGGISYEGILYAPNGAANEAVDVLISYSLSGSVFVKGYLADNGFSDAALTIYGAGCGTYECFVGGGASLEGDTPRSFAQSGTLHRTLLTGNIFSVTLDAGARFRCDVCDDGDYPGYGHVTAFVDPVFTVDPSFAATHPGYGFAFSQGIGNALGSVPEPASWALMIAGFGLVGGALRRRPRATAAIA